MALGYDGINFQKTADNVWECKAYRSTTYTLTITKTGNNHAVVANPGAVAVGTYPTLRQAKNACRKYLLDK